MGKGWAAASPRSTADCYFISESAQRLPPVRVCTPPARGEGAMLRGNYTSSSSEVSLDRTPLGHGAVSAPIGRQAAAQQLMHWHSVPAEDHGHLQPAACDAQKAQGGSSHCAQLRLTTPQHSPRSACRSTCSTAATSCPLCPDSEAKLAAARDAVVDLMQRLTDATEERDEALAAAQREWRLAELLRQELAATPDHPQAHAASSCGRPSCGLRSSRIPDSDSSDRFDADWQAARRDLAASGDAFLTPRSSIVSPAHCQRRRHAADAAETASEAYFTPSQQLLPTQHSTTLLQARRSSNAKRRSSVRRRLMDSSWSLGRAEAMDDTAAPWLLQTPSYGTPSAAACTSSPFYEAGQQTHSAELAAAEARVDALEQKLSSAASFIAQLLLPQGSGLGTAESPGTSRRQHSTAEWPTAAAADTDGLLQRLQYLAMEAADVSRAAADGVGQACSGSGSRLSTQQQQHGALQRGRCSRLSTTSRELPLQAADSHARAPDAAPSVSGAGDPGPCVSSHAPSEQSPGSPIAAMQEAVKQMSMIARRVRAVAQVPAGMQATAAAAAAASSHHSAAQGAPCSAGHDGCAAPRLEEPTAAHVALTHARTHMASATQALATRSAESLRLLSPSTAGLLTFWCAA